MKVKIVKLNPKAIIPKYQTRHSAGMDLHACVKEPINLKPNMREVIPTGIAIALLGGYEAQVRPRSGLAAKYGITVANAPGTIDADYRGEVGVILINLGQEYFIIKNGDRIAQMVVAKYERVVFDETDGIGKTERGTGGFGSTGR